MRNRKVEKNNLVRIGYSELKSVLEKILSKEGFSEKDSSELAEIFSDNSLFGKDSHGVNRFLPFIDSVKNGYVKNNVKPVLINTNNALEQWDGNYGAGPLNAKFCTNRAINLADKFGLGCIALRNSNHWMRGGTYGWQAAEAGFIFMCWTNAIPTMPAWGAIDPRLGNNPLVLAVPKKNGNIVLDMALTQYSYGKLETLLLAGEETEYYAGYNKQGDLTKIPEDVLETKRALPIGLWKGSGLSLMLDLIASLLSQGRTTSQIGNEKVDTGVSQIFIAIKPNSEESTNSFEKIINEILSDLSLSQAINNEEILYPGELSYRKKSENIEKGIPVNVSQWNAIQKLL